MISVQDANDIITRNPLILTTEEVSIKDAIGRTISEDIKADRAFPPFDRVMMDGIAVRYSDYESTSIFQIIGIQGAGQKAQRLPAGAFAIEVMTGTVIPPASDTVIRYEDLDINEHQVSILDAASVKKGQNIHRKGTDRSQEDILIPAGTVLSAAEIGVAATVGKTHLVVLSLPKLMIISTGDELVDINQQPLPYQIRRSNSYQIQALLKSHNLPSETIHIKDDLAIIKSTLSSLLQSHDALILSGGVSMGKFDYLPQALSDLGVDQHFHKIAQRPGKPMWFGTSSHHACTVFALPGNPVSTFSCSVRYVLPWIKRGLSHQIDNRSAILAADFSFAPSLTYFLQVKTKWTNGQLMAYPITGKGSGDLANLVEVDGFLEIPSDRSHFQKGDVFPYYKFR